MKKVILKSISAHSDEIDELPINYKDSWLMHRKYVEFCKQSLNLGMFVPAKIIDGGWVVLEEPFNDGQNDQYYSSAMEEYQETKSRCLFEGWHYKKDCMGFKKVYSSDFQINLDTLECEFYIDGMHFEDFKLKGNNIESLSNQLSGILLTQTAQKQIGL